MTFDSSEDNKNETKTWTESTATGSSREEPRRLPFTFSTDEYTSQEKQTKGLVAGTKRRLKRRLARASETPEETAARQEHALKRMREARASETPEETAARQEGDMKRKKGARASETPEETAARQGEDAKRKCESREAARLKVNADDAEHARQRRSADSAARQEALARTRDRAAHAAALQESTAQAPSGDAPLSRAEEGQCRIALAAARSTISGRICDILNTTRNSKNTKRSKRWHVKAMPF